MDIKKTELNKILPHNPPMILIDEILEIDTEQNAVRTLVHISEDKVFFDKTTNGVSPLVGIEFMAQTIGCYSHFQNKEEKPKIGFLLGTRSYICDIEKFKKNKDYEIYAKEVFTDNQLVSFDCFIYNNGQECARATVNAYQPNNLESLDL